MLFKKRQKLEVKFSWKTNEAVDMIRAGRRYRTDVPYILPKDDQEVSRLDFQHYALRQFFKGNYLAPLGPDLRNILDVGYGTGRWMREMAEAFPQARVIGMDIEAAPLPVSYPSNCFFALADLLRGLPFPNNSFDLTHQRLLVGAIPAARWPYVVSELVRVTAPGGWIELLEAGCVYHSPGPLTEQMLEWWRIAAPRVGFDLSFVPHLDDLFRQYGLKNVQLHTFSLPLGRWGGRAGDLLAMDLESVLSSLREFYQLYSHTTSEQFDNMMRNIRSEWEIYHTQFEFYSIYGQKVENEGGYDGK